jgi:hypothetical protein
MDGRRTPYINAFRRGDLAQTLQRYGCSPGDVVNILQTLHLIMDLPVLDKDANSLGKAAIGGMRRNNLRYVWAQVQDLMGQPQVWRAVEAVAHDLLDHPNRNRAKQVVGIIRQVLR